jgi:hypothetical protein
MAMNLLGIGLSDAKHHEDALIVQEAELSTMRRVGTSERNILAVQCNLASTYDKLGRRGQALQMREEILAGSCELYGEEAEGTLRAALNCATSLGGLQRFEESKVLLRKTIPVARRVLGEGHDLTLRMRWCHAMTLYDHPAATLYDVRESVATLEELGRTVRRVLGGAHPFTMQVEKSLRISRAVLRARETPSPRQPNQKQT